MSALSHTIQEHREKLLQVLASTSSGVCPVTYNTRTQREAAASFSIHLVRCLPCHIQYKNTERSCCKFKHSPRQVSVLSHTIQEHREKLLQGLAFTSSGVCPVTYNTRTQREAAASFSIHLVRCLPCDIQYKNTERSCYKF